MRWPLLRRASQDFNTLTLRKCYLMPHCVSPAAKEAFPQEKGKGSKPPAPFPGKKQVHVPVKLRPRSHSWTQQRHNLLSCLWWGWQRGLAVRRQVDSRSQIVLVWAQTEVLLYFFLPMCTWAHSWFICDFISSRIKWEHNDCLTGLLKRMNKWLGQNENEMNICEKIIV